MRIHPLLCDLADLITNQVQKEEHFPCYPAANLIIYKNNFKRHLTYALKSCYPGILLITGDEYFEQLAEIYIELYPSLSGDLNQYGEFFSQFLNGLPQLEQLPYLSDVAAFEWGMHLVKNAPASDNEFSFQKLQKLTPNQYEHMYFVTHPALQLCYSKFSIESIIDTCYRNIHHAQIQFDQGPTFLLLYQSNMTADYQVINLGEYELLKELINRESLSTALKKANIGSEFPLLATLLKWIQEKILLDIEISSA